MSYLVLARKYRPRRFEEVIGQEAISQTLTHAITTGRVAHAYLFAGQRGVGKTSMARILASALNCAEGPTPEPCGQCPSCLGIARGEDVDVLEIDGASNTGVDNIRELRSNARYAPARSRFKIYYVDEVHMLSKSAFNALLKTLEEPPKHVKFIFSTTEPHRIPETIHSRCQRFDFRGIAPQAIVDQLACILEAEGLAGDADVLATLARRSRGSLRDGVSLLDQLISATGAATDLDALERLLGLADREQVEAMAQAVTNRDPAQALKVIERLVQDGRSLGEFLNLFIEMLREALLMATCGEDTDLVATRDAARTATANLAGALGANTLLYAMHLCAETLRRLARATDERLPVEMAAVKLCTTDPLVPLADLVSRLERLARGRPGMDAAGSPAGNPSRGQRAEPRRRGSQDDAPPGDEYPSMTGTGTEGPASPAGRSRGSTAARPQSVAESPRGSGEAAWDAVVQAVAEGHRRVAAMLREGTILSLDEEALVLAFSPEHRVFIDYLSDPQTAALVAAEMERAFGRRIRLQFAAADPSIGSSQEERASVSDRADPTLRERALADPVVRSVMDVLSARLVAVRLAAADRPAADGGARVTLLLR